MIIKTQNLPDPCPPLVIKYHNFPNRHLPFGIRHYAWMAPNHKYTNIINSFDFIINTVQNIGETRGQLLDGKMY